MSDDTAAQEAFDGFVAMWTTGTTGGRRAPVLRRPDEVGLDYEDVFFPSMDGVPLEGWFIPADSDRLIIHNHFLPGNRYGYPGHLPEFGGLGGFEVMNRTIDIAQSALARHTLAAYPPDLFIEVPRNVCRSLEFHRATEVIEIGRELGAAALDSLEKSDT